jgi:antitoxin component YwqK of YwqJK toxin-antitoxin module
MNKYLVLFLFLLLGCSQQDIVEVVIIKDNKGNVVSEIPYIKDSIKEGLAKFYENGVLRKEVMYKNDQKDGWYTFYYPNGKLHSKVLYRNGRQNGK